MPQLPVLDYSALHALALEGQGITGDCSCQASTYAAWVSVPPTLPEAQFTEVGTLLQDPFAEPAFEEYHPQGTQNSSALAPIAPRYFPYNRCTVSRCTACGRYFLRYTESGGYFFDRRMRSLQVGLLVDAELPPV